MKKRILFALFFFQLTFCKSLDFKKVIIWGHKLHSHTHSYIHEAFYRAFKHLGHETYWLDDKDDVRNFNFDHCLFITEGQVDKRIPINNTSFYILHNCFDDKKYAQIKDKGRVIILQVYSDKYRECFEDNKEVEPYIFVSLSEQIIFMPWATNLLPHEIDIQKEKVRKNWKKTKKKEVCWIGSIGDGPVGNRTEINPFVDECEKNDLRFIHRINVSMQENVDVVYYSFMAPTIVGKCQRREGYIPCRIFKNISYGQMGITNSEAVYNIFNKQIVYDKDPRKLFQKSYDKIKNMALNEQLELMDFVKEHHTYISRIKTLLSFMQEVYSFNNL